MYLTNWLGRECIWPLDEEENFQVHISKAFENSGKNNESAVHLGNSSELSFLTFFVDFDF